MKNKANRCTGCKNSSSKDCGKVIPDKSNGSIRYIKVTDDRCLIHK